MRLRHRDWLLLRPACGARYGPCEAAALQERMKRAVALLGEDEVKAILETEGRIEVRRNKGRVGCMA